MIFSKKYVTRSCASNGRPHFMVRFFRVVNGVNKAIFKEKVYIDEYDSEQLAFQAACKIADTMIKYFPPSRIDKGFSEIAPIHNLSGQVGVHLYYYKKKKDDPNPIPWYVASYRINKKPHQDNFSYRIFGEKAKYFAVSRRLQMQAYLISFENEQQSFNRIKEKIDKIKRRCGNIQKAEKLQEKVDEMLSLNKEANSFWGISENLIKNICKQLKI